MALLRESNRDGKEGQSWGPGSTVMAILPQVLGLSRLWASTSPVCFHILVVPPSKWSFVKEILLFLLGKTPK